MPIGVDASELVLLDRRLASTGRVFDSRLTGQMLKTALAPTLAAVKQNAPVGNRRFRSSATRTSRAGRLKRDGTYDRGGATRRDARIKIVAGVGIEVVRALVGISKARGRVGWRTHLITRANKHRRVANDFLTRSETQTYSIVIANLNAAARSVVAKALSRR